MILNLDKTFAPIAGEEIQYESFTFSGGEPHIKLSTAPSFLEKEIVTVTHRLNSFNDLGLLCMAVDAVKRMDATLGTLYIPYFPAARQDRLMIKGEPLSVKVYVDIINGFGFKKVLVYDVHSEVTPALLHNCEVIANHHFIKQVIETLGTTVKLISPDGGALKKIYKVAEYLGGTDVVECSKSRDVKTGKLKEFKVYDDDLGGIDCLIVDDICDGGGTFLGLAEELKKKNAGKLYLAVSHGIFSKGLEELGKYFEGIFCTDSVRELSGDGLTQIKLKEIL